MSLSEQGNRIAADLDRLRADYAQALQDEFLAWHLTEGLRACRQAAAYGRRVRERVEEVRGGYLRDAYAALCGSAASPTATWRRRSMRERGHGHAGGVRGRAAGCVTEKKGRAVRSAKKTQPSAQGTQMNLIPPPLYGRNQPGAGLESIAELVVDRRAFVDALWVLVDVPPSAKFMKRLRRKCREGNAHGEDQSRDGRS